MAIQAGQSRACKWLATSVNAFLLDVYGVLYDTGSSDIPIPGSVEAVKKLKSAGIPFRLCSNTTTKTSQRVAETLTSLGFDISSNEIFTPIPAVKQYIKQHQLRPFLIVDPSVENEFKELDQTDPNCIVLGDATDAFTYSRLNTAFRLLLERPGTELITMGIGKYYKDVDGLMLDVGPFTKALEYASGVQATVIGKPSKEFFMAALASMNVESQNAVMVGDDIESDVGGAQACGIRGLQVRTGKYRPVDEPHISVKPDAYVNNLLQAVDDFLEYSRK